MANIHLHSSPVCLLLFHWDLSQAASKPFSDHLYYSVFSTLVLVNRLIFFMVAFKHLSPCLFTAAQATCFLSLVYRKMHTRDSSFQQLLIRLLRLRSEQSNFKGNFLELAPVLPAYQSSLLKKLIS